MTRQSRRALVFALLLAALAGYVDAIGFFGMGGFFVSFMSGNSTRLGAGLAIEAWPTAFIGWGLISSFVGGVVVATLLAHLIPVRSRPPAVLALVTTLLLLAALRPFGIEAAMACLAAAMGSSNIVFANGGEVRFGVTYMTGALVKMGQGIAAALIAPPRFAWARWFLLWLSLVAGAVAGGHAFLALALDAIWPATTAAGILTLAAWWILPEIGVGG